MKFKQHNRWLLFNFLLLFLLTVGLTGCPQNTTMTEEELKQAYAHAIEDARVAEPEEICHHLVAITPENKHLTWDNSSDEKRVLVVTWTAWTGYDDLVGQNAVMTRDVWVTVAPQVQNFARWNVPFTKDLILRTEQLLGLPPHNGKTRFVELWAKPSELFRPSPDPEITDNEATLDFPMANGFLVITDTYLKWFNDLKTASYGTNGYPWTRLGYTYDWGNPVSEVGLSEFVLPPGASVTVRRVVQTENYLTATTN